MWVICVLLWNSRPAAVLLCSHVLILSSSLIYGGEAPGSPGGSASYNSLQASLTNITNNTPHFLNKLCQWLLSLVDTQVCVVNGRYDFV